MPKVLCDTDFIIKISSQPIPALRGALDESDLVLATIPQVVRELEGLRQNKSILTSRKARGALELIGKSITVETASKRETPDADIALFEHARELEPGSFVATLDGNLLSMLESNQISYLTLRKDKPFFRSFGKGRYLSAKNP